MATQGRDLFAYGKSCFERFSRELARYGIEVDPRTELRRGSGVLCYYHLEDGHIYIAVPDLDTPVGKLQAMVLASTLALEGEAELVALFDLFIPHLIAHEMAHHLRHRYGTFGENKWAEEQIANQLAIALTKRSLSPKDRAFALELLGRTLAFLSAKLELRDAATLSYHDILSALNASGRLADSATERAQVTQKLFSCEPGGMMQAAGDLTDSMHAGLALREELIREINEQYAGEFQKYVYYHAGWLHLDLASHGAEYVEDFGRERLGLRVEQLPPVPPPASISDASVIATYRAYRDCRPCSEPGARYFYKRYRFLLWEKLRSEGLVVPTQTAILDRESSFFLESWDEGASDALEYVASLAKEEVRALFPTFIGKQLDSIASVEDDLPCETDVRLYCHVVQRRADPAAEATLHRFALLDQTDIFRPVPAETMLELARTLCRVHVDDGETLIWEGEVNDDVFFLTQGGLDVLVRGVRVAAIEPGEMFGEMAFFSRDTRNATVRARGAAECFVIKDVALLSLVFRHPSVLMQMAGVLTRRLADVNLRLIRGEGPRAPGATPFGATPFGATPFGVR